MKNVSCLKLSIDRSRVPKKMGTFKDISQYGNFIFPLDGEYAAGIIARSLAGIGKEVKKTNAQLQKISSRDNPMAGSTGSSVSSELPPAEEGEFQGHPTQDETYSIRFINHAQEPLQTPSFIQSERTDRSLQPSNGFALKKASRKRVVFSLEQKEIMISFYNRQATTGIRAEPKDVIASMRAQGVEVLKESQIVSWWSTYHQKKKRLLAAEVENLRSLHPSPCNSDSTVPVQQSTPVCTSSATIPVQQSTSVHVTGSTVPVQHSTPVCTSSSTIPVQQSTSVHVTGSTVPVQQSTPVCTSSSTIPVQQSTSVHVTGSTVPVQQSTPVCTSSSTVPVQQSTSVHVTGSTVPVQQSTSHMSLA